MGQAIAKVRYTHEALIDMIVGNPAVSQGELAAHFGYTEGWISQVIASDAFQARLAARRADVVDPLLLRSVKEKLEGLAHRSLDVLQQKLEAPMVADATVLKAVELSTKALGYGAQMDKVPQAPAPLERLADNITLIFNQRKENLINGTEATYTRIPDQTTQAISDAEEAAA
jgi:hypothetical protein